MKVTDAKFTKRFNTGDYEHEEYTLSAQVEEGEDGASALLDLKAEVVAAFMGQATAAPVETKTEVKPKTKKQKPQETKNARTKANNTDDEDTDDENSASEDAGDDGESDQDDEATDSENSDDSDDSTDDSEDSSDDNSEEDGDDEDSKPAKKGSKPVSSGKAGSKEGSSKKSFRKKPQGYNRAIDQHKEIFSGVLRYVAPDYKKSEASKLKAKETSIKMSGKEFLDEDGEVLESFKAEVKKLMSSSKKK